MTRFFVEVVDEPEILADIRNGRTGLDWTVVGERRYAHPWPSTGWNWLFEIECPDAPPSVAGMLIDPTVWRDIDDGSISIDYNPQRAVYPRLESGASA